MNNIDAPWELLPKDSRGAMPPEPTDSSDVQPALSRQMMTSLASIATSAWAVCRKVQQGASNADTGQLLVHTDAIFDALRQMGVEIVVYTDQLYQGGLDVEILTFQPSPAVEKDTITATVRPAVLFQGQIIQRGQVIVSTPEERKT